MGWINNIMKKLRQATAPAASLNGYAPIYSQFGQNIYASDVVQQAINCIVQEMKKLSINHIRSTGDDVIPMSGSLQNVLNNPNELMTTSEFIEKIVWNLFLNFNSFIVPSYDVWLDENGNEKRTYRALYPVQPYQVDFIEDARGELFVKMRFANDYETTLSYDDVIHIKYRYSVNEYMGGNEQGQPDNDALLETLNLNYQLLQSISSSLKSSMALNGVVKINTLVDKGKTEANLKEFEEKLKNSESGFVAIDMRNEVIPLKKDVKLVDESTLKFIDEKILRHYGVPLAILTGDYTKAQYEAFYQKTLEPLVIAISQAFTKKLFTARERSFGNKIMLYTKDLIFMTTDQTIEMVRLLGDSGSLYENEKRTAFGLRPLPELVGVRMMSLNYVNAEYAKEYQMKEGSGDEA